MPISKLNTGVPLLWTILKMELSDYIKSNRPNTNSEQLLTVHDRIKFNYHLMVILWIFCCTINAAVSCDYNTHKTADIGVM